VLDAMIVVWDVVVTNMLCTFMVCRCVVGGVISDCSVECCGERMRCAILL